MSLQILYQCPLFLKKENLVQIYQLLVSDKILIITKINQNKLQEKAYDITVLTTQISWDYNRENLVQGFQISFLSYKTGQIKNKQYNGHPNDLEKLKKVLDGRAFYNQFYKQYALISKKSYSEEVQIQQCQNIYTNVIKIRKRLPLQKNYLFNDVIPSEVELAVKLKSYPHKYILSIDEIYLEEDGIYLIMDHCQGGTLFKYFCNQNFEIPQKQILQIMKRILKAVNHLHENEIMHRDLKFENILLKYDNDIKSLKIIDMGLASEINQKPLIYCGTPGYIAPEILNGKPYNQLCDVYSLGCLFHCLLSGDRHLPIYIDEEHHLKQNCFEISRKIKDSLARDLIKRMLNPQSKRPSPIDCLNHPFFQLRSEPTHSIQDKIKQMDFPIMKNPFKVL